MENLIYVTGNYGKYIAVKRCFEKYGVEIEFEKYNFDEPNVNNIEFISKEKARCAYEKFQKSCFVADSGFYIDDYPNNPGYPGAFVNRSGISNNIDELLLKMKDKENRRCRFLDCLTFYDGKEFYQFYGISEGVLAKEKRGVETKERKSNLWYVFIPKNCTKTLAEMTIDERLNRSDEHTSATENFIEWYTEVYNNKKVRIKKIDQK